jgi:hypothetical protein
MRAGRTSVVFATHGYSLLDALWISGAGALRAPPAYTDEAGRGLLRGPLASVSVEPFSVSGPHRGGRPPPGSEEGPRPDGQVEERVRRVFQIGPQELLLEDAVHADEHANHAEKEH